jgi:dihydropyrimidine dehydrogenase (NAD+) subunit PreT
MSDNRLTPQQAQFESGRCLYCFDAPCVQACPVHIDIPTFIAMIRSGNVRGAAEVVKTSNAFANVCGRVCPEEVFCQSVCTRAKQDEPIRIRELHYFATQTETWQGSSMLMEFPKRETKVAIVGGGPSGLSCAFELAKLGHTPVVYESNGIGGVPKHSIPHFRLDDRTLHNDLEFITPSIEVRKELVTPRHLRRLRAKYAAVYLAVGLGQDRVLGIPGEGLAGVFPVLEFLRVSKCGKSRPPIGGRVVVVGGGNVSLDAAATARRLGAGDVTVLYRRSEREMKVWNSELNEARKQGVEFRFLTAPVEILGDTKVTGILCRRTELSERVDRSRRPIPIEVVGSEFTIPASSVIVAVGQTVGTELRTQFKRNAKGFITVSTRLQTSLEGIFAGGDAINGEGTIVQAVADGVRAAHEIHRHILKGKLEHGQG